LKSQGDTVFYGCKQSPGVPAKETAQFHDYVTEITAHCTSLQFEHNYDPHCVTYEMENFVEPNELNTKLNVRKR